MSLRLADAPGCGEASSVIGVEPLVSRASTVTGQITCGLSDQLLDDCGGGRASCQSSSSACWRLRLAGSKLTETAI